MLYRELAVRRMLRWADAGVTEMPLGSNWGGKVKVFLSRIGLGPNPWCQAGLYSAFKLSGFEIIKTGLVSAFWRWAEPRGWTYRRGWIHPARGDAIVFEWDSRLGRWGSGDVLDHVGFVVEVENGWVHTVECNKRDAVRLDKYRIDDTRIYGYVRVPGRRKAESRGRAPVPRLVKFAGRYAVMEGDKEIGRGRLRPMRALWRERYKRWADRR